MNNIPLVKLREIIELNKKLIHVQIQTEEFSHSKESKRDLLLFTKDFQDPFLLALTAEKQKDIISYLDSARSITLSGYLLGVKYYIDYHISSMKRLKKAYPFYHRVHLNNCFKEYQAQIVKIQKILLELNGKNFTSIDISEVYLLFEYIDTLETMQIDAYSNVNVLNETLTQSVTKFFLASAFGYIVYQVVPSLLKSNSNDSKVFEVLVSYCIKLWFSIQSVFNILLDFILHRFK